MSDAEDATSPGPAPADVREGLLEGYFDHGYVRCKACHNRMVPLEDAESMEEAIRVWNDHVRDQHDGGLEMGGDGR